MKETHVGLGEQAVSRDPEDILVAYGLGSCVGVVMTDPLSRLSGLLHAVLPRPPSESATDESQASKYVETGIEFLVASLVKAGARQGSLVARIVGGANMLMSTGMTSSFDIGTRNIEAARHVLGRLNIPIAAAEVGGHMGRTLRVYVAGARVTVRVIGEKEHEI